MNTRPSTLLKAVREQQPLVHHITNYVTIHDCANIVLALGGVPVMADAPEEVEEMVSGASSLVINMGKPSSQAFKSMLLAGKKANQLGIPVILDPVGAGATRFRKDFIQEFLGQIHPAVIRGNLSEIKFLSGMEASFKGIDSAEYDENPAAIVTNLGHALECVAVLTGETDTISDGSSTFTIRNGHPILSRITGTGCMVTSLIAAFAGVTDDYLAAAALGVLTMGIAGEKAHHSLEDSEGVGTFKVRLFDAVHQINAADFTKYGKLSSTQ